VIINLKADPYETMHRESPMYWRWYADNMWLFVPIQAKIKAFLGSLEGYPFQEGSSLSASGINYRSLKAYKILKQLEKNSYINR
jgi:arylsulfatase